MKKDKCGNEYDTVDFVVVLETYSNISRKKGKPGGNVGETYYGLITQNIYLYVQKFWIVKPISPPERSHPVDCFLNFLIITFFEKFVKWTTVKIKSIKGDSYTKKKIDSNDVMVLVVIFCIMGIVNLPSEQLYIFLGISQALNSIGIEVSDTERLQEFDWYNFLDILMQCICPIKIEVWCILKGRRSIFCLSTPKFYSGEIPKDLDTNCHTHVWQVSLVIQGD